MKLNIAYPRTGCQKVIEVDDENKLRTFYDKKIAQEVDGDVLGDDFKGYVFKITGGNDKQGFPMKQGILTASRVRLLLSDGHTCYRTRKTGERKRKSIRGCIVSSELSVLNLVVVKTGLKEIVGLTEQKPRRHAPKRASHIRKLFSLDDKKDDVRSVNIKRRIAKEGQKAYFKHPKIQRLITPQRLQRKRHEFHIAQERIKKSRAEAEDYNKLMAARYKEARDKRQLAIQKRRSASTRKSGSTGAPATGAAAATATAPKPAGAGAAAAAAAAPAAKPAGAPTAGAAKPADKKKSDKKKGDKKKGDKKTGAGAAAQAPAAAKVPAGQKPA